MRVFVGLDIPTEIRERISAYMEHARVFAPEARWVRPESLHVTLKFIGEVSEVRVEHIKRALLPIQAQPLTIEFKDSGFFPDFKNARVFNARVFWIGVHASDALAQLAATVDTALVELGLPREEKAFHPHLTPARAPQERTRNQCFQQLQQHIHPDETLSFGTMTAKEFFLFKSELLRGGARYTKVERFPLA